MSQDTLIRHLSESVTPTSPPSAVSVISDAATDAGSTIAASWINTHPEWAGVIGIALVFAAMFAEYLRRKAKATPNPYDDIAADALVDAVAKTKDKTDA